MRPSTFRKAMGRDPRRTAPFAVPVAPPVALPQAALFFFWHPERDGVEPCHQSFDRQLKLIHPNLYAVRPPPNAPAPVDRRWILWQRDPTVTHPICRGWTLLFLWPPMEFAPIPLDNRVFANLAVIDPRRYASGRAYFDTIVEQMQSDHDQRDRSHKQYLHDCRKDLAATWKISSAGRGNRFALHHDGTVIPSRGESNWSRERERLLLPGDVMRSRKDQGLGRSKK